MSERNGTCPSCYGSGRIVNVINQAKGWKESGDCMMCGGTGFWGGAYPSPLSRNVHHISQALKRKMQRKDKI